MQRPHTETDPATPAPAVDSAPGPEPEPPSPTVQRPIVPASPEATPVPATPPTSAAPPTPPVRTLEPPGPPSTTGAPPGPVPPVATLPPAEPSPSSIDPVSQAQRAEATRRLVGARTLMAVGGVSLATGLMMVLGAGIEASKKPCDFEQACEDPPRGEVVRGLAAGGGVLTALGAVAVGFSIPAAKRARLELDASRTQARVAVRVRF